MWQTCIDERCVGEADAGPQDGGSWPGDAARPDSGADAGDPVGRRCDDARPCPTGYVCEEGACAIDCSGNARCDGACCGAGEICHLGECTMPGEECAADLDSLRCVAARCPMGEQCDPAIGRCLPLPPAVECSVVPEGTFEPELLWAWTGSSEHPTYQHIFSTPAVMDLDGDGISDILVAATNYTTGGFSHGAILCALAGAGDCDGAPRELWCTSPSDPMVVMGHPAVADLTGDGELTIVVGGALTGAAAGAHPSPHPSALAHGLYGYRANGERIPTFGTDAAGNRVHVYVGSGAPAIADLDGDGRAEVFIGYTLFDHEGRLRWHRAGGSGNGSYGPQSIAADLDGDGDLEIVGGNRAYHHDGTEFWPADAPARTLADGWPAVADFNGDGVPEIVVVTNGVVRVLTNMGALYGSASFATFPGSGGPPTIADVDGDGRPEIAIAGRDSLRVFSVGDGPEHALTLHWAVASRDFSSSMTGSSVFDFDGDGRAEVIYADECFARVYDGIGDGEGGTTVRFQVPNTSCTGTEYPVVADVTGNGKAEFIVVSNDFTGTASACAPYAAACATAFPGYERTRGVRVYRDREDNWVSTRAVWNQHSYHVTNVCDGHDRVCDPAENGLGRVPRRERSSWAFPADAPLNRYRVNARLDGVFAAPDLALAEMRADLRECPTAVTLRALATNLGSAGAPAGIPVTFFHVDGAERTQLGTVLTRSVLLPGGGEWVSLRVEPVPTVAEGPLRFEAIINVDAEGASTARECADDNNASSVEVFCDLL